MSDSVPEKKLEPYADIDLQAGPMHQNIESILAFYTREEQKISPSQRLLEKLSSYLERPIYPIAIIFFVLVWILGNEIVHWMGGEEFDPAPFFWLQGVVSLGALLTTTVVLIKQRRLGKLAEQRAHLDLQVNLLTEQKTTKLIQLIEELRRDLPNVKNRQDDEANALQKPTNPEAVLAALNEYEKADSDEPNKK